MTRRWPMSVAVATTVAFTLACEGSVEGERAASGACPEGEACSDEVSGLVFQGQVLYDEFEDRLGPVLVGGRFDLSFYALGGVLDTFSVTLEGGGLEVESSGLASLSLLGKRPGDTVVLIVDPDTGELYDRLTLTTVQIEDVVLENVTEPERSVLLAGCEEMIGVRLVAEGGQLRAFDQDVAVRAEGEVTPDPMVWDCFRYTVPADAAFVAFEITAGGETYVRELEVAPLVEGQSCPVLSD